MIEKQFDKYILFIRFNLELTAFMKYTMLLQVLPKNDMDSFIKFINNWVLSSEKNNSYVNIWKIHGNTLYKVAYIDKGALNSL